MAGEQSGVPNGNQVQFRMWNIKTHDAQLVSVNKIRYEKFFIFVGEQTIYWLYYRRKPIYCCVEGSTALTFNYCCCCFHKQYMKFIEHIQDKNKDPSDQTL